MKILLLSNNDNVNTLYEWIREKGNEVTLFRDPITAQLIDELMPDLVISYNYQHIVKEDVITRMGNMIINLHTSFLPWNKGASPNIWSFIEDTPKGVTIHRLEKGLDTGKIIVQKQFEFDEDIETLSSTYSKLNEGIVQLLMDNWEMISSGEFTLQDQIGKGSYHTKSDLVALLNGRHIDYSMTISDFKAFIRSCE